LSLIGQVSELAAGGAGGAGGVCRRILLAVRVSITWPDLLLDKRKGFIAAFTECRDVAEISLRPPVPPAKEQFGHSEANVEARKRTVALGKIRQTPCMHRLSIRQHMPSRYLDSNLSEWTGSLDATNLL